MIFNDFFTLFCARKNWRLLTQVSRTAHHDSSVSRANSFTGQAESRKCRFPRGTVVFRGLALWLPIIFPHTKWLPKITDYRDTAALNWAGKSQQTWCGLLTRPAFFKIKQAYTGQGKELAQIRREVNRRAGLGKI